MAIIGKIATFLPAFGKNILTFQEDHATAPAQFRMSLKYSPDAATAAQQYVKAVEVDVIGLTEIHGIFDAKGVLSSMLAGHTDLITALNVGAVSDRTSASRVPYQRTIRFVIQSLDAAGAQVSTSGDLDRKVIKAVDSRYRTEWKGNPSFIAVDNVGGEAIRVAFKNQYIPICFYSDVAGGRDVYVNDTKLHTYAACDGIHILLYRDNATQSINTIQVTDATRAHTHTPVFKYILDNKCYKRSKTLYFMNYHGGWEWYNFVDYEQYQRTEKSHYTVSGDAFGDFQVHQYVTDSRKELKLYGRPILSSMAYYLRNLITSPIVIDEDNARVRVIDAVIPTDLEGMVEPEVTIQYLEENVLTY